MSISQKRNRRQNRKPGTKHEKQIQQFHVLKLELFEIVYFLFPYFQAKAGVHTRPISLNIGNVLAAVGLEPHKAALFYRKS